MNTKHNGLCQNYTRCSNADNKIPVEVSILMDFVCPICGQDLIPIQKKIKLSIPKPIFIIIPIVVILLVVVGYIFFQSNKSRLIQKSTTTVLPADNEKIVQNNPISAVSSNESNNKLDKKSDDGTENSKILEKTIINLITAEDNRDLNAIFSNYSKNIETYWNIQHPTTEQLEKIYTTRWQKQSKSENVINSVEKIDKNTFDLNNTYYYTIKKTGEQKTISSIIRFKLDNEGKINYIYCLKTNI